MSIDLASATDREAPWLGAVRAALDAGPGPDRARHLAESVLAEIADSELADLGARRAEALADVLAGCCGVAPFLAMFLRRHPEWVGALAEDDLAEPRTRDSLAAHLDRLLADAAGEPAAEEEALRRFKYYELARITVRDARRVPLAESQVIFREISLLADAFLDGAFGVAMRRIGERVGPPVWRDAAGGEVRLGFSVLGLGKLGAEELNFSSDVDLVYVTETPPAGGPLLDGPGDLGPEAYFSRVAREFGSLVNTRTSDGFGYRIDLELRPGGSEGPLLVTDDVLAGYYETAAATWEKAAFMKARPVAGDAELGWRTIRSVSPMIYSSSMDFNTVRDIKALKERIESHRGGDESRFDVKLDAGGIRDVEFVAQSLQLLHGGRIPQVRERGTVRSLQALAGVSILTPEQAATLVDAYLFLRRVENRLQMEEERQTQKLPTDDAGRTRLARGMGFETAGEFADALALQRRRVTDEVARLFSDGGSDRIIDLFVRCAPGMMGFPATRSMLEQLAEDFATAVDASPDPERALNNLDRFVRGVGSRRFYYELLLDRPELISRLTALFGSSRFLSETLARHPRHIEPLFEHPDRLLLDKDELRADMASLRDAQEDRDDTESTLASLRLFHLRQTLNVALLDADQRIERRQVQTALTEIAEVCLEEALEAARAWKPPPPGSEFLVVGMGKLGSRELGYGSDLDLIFVYDVADGTDVAEAQAQFVKIAQRLISLLQTPTGEGTCYEIDARMRPSGNQGSLVTSLASLERYHATHALAWERLALLRARGVAGDERLREAYERLREELLLRPLPDDLREETHRIRRRMETEIAKETQQRHDFKTGRGGVLDVETIVQYLRLEHGHEHPALLAATDMDDQMGRLGEYGLLPEAALRDLTEGWEFLQRLGSRLRIVENRSISDLDEERGDLDGLARRLGYPAGSHQAGPRRALLRDYRMHTDRIRAAYESVFEVRDGT